MSTKIKVNLIAGSGSYQGPGKWLFSDIINIIKNNINENKFEINITEKIDDSQLYDVYHYFHSTLAALNGHKMMHRSIVSIQEMGDFAPNYSFESKETSFKMAKIITSPSTTITRTLVQRGIDNKIKYLPLGVNIQDFYPVTYEEACQSIKDLGLEDNKIRFGIISKRYENGKKGEDFLMQIISKSFNNSDLYKFMFVGVGWKEYLCQAIEEYGLDYDLFEIYERDVDCTYQDYPNLYSCMDAVLVTSQIDAGPVCILEGLAKGLPVISTTTGLANELLVKRINGQIIGNVIQYGDIYGFTEAMYNIEKNINEFRNIDNRKNIAQIITSPNLYEPINKYSIVEDPQDYTWNSFCQRIEKLYKEIYDDCKDKNFIEDFMDNQTQSKFISFYSQQATNNLTNRYMENYSLVKGYAKDGIGIVNFKDVLKDQPAVIVGAGPSLDKDIITLHTYQKSINILACDAALPILLKNGIIPDVVIVADPSDRQVQNFTGCNGKEFMTIMPTIVHPMTFNEARKYDCSILWYNVADSNIDLCKWIPKEVGYKGIVRPAVLTSGMVYQIALWLGCNNITFLGHDLSWADINKGYATGVSDQKAMYQKNNKMFNQPVFLFPNIYGDIVTTELSFINFIQWINSYLKEHKLTVFNSTDCGILYGENIIQMNFNDWCEKYNTVLNPPTFPLLYQIYREIKLGNDIPIIP